MSVESGGRPAPFPVSYSGPDSIHIHGGLLHQGDDLPAAPRFLAWARRLENQVETYLEGIPNTETRTHFHLLVPPHRSPTFEVWAEVHAVLGAWSAGHEPKEACR